MDLELIKKNYAESATFKLLKLVDTVKELNEEAVPLLIAELKKRKEVAALQKIQDILNPPERQEVDYTELKAEVLERIKEGESIESIKHDLKERLGDDDYYHFLANEVNQAKTINDELFLKAAATIIDNQIQNNKNEDELKTELLNQGLNSVDAEKIINSSNHNKELFENTIKEKLKKRTKNDLIFGPIILVIGLIITIGSLAGSNYIIITYGAIISGIAKTIRGIYNLNSISKSSNNNFTN